jgi:antitoxin ParD1/3/4
MSKRAVGNRGGHGPAQAALSNIDNVRQPRYVSKEQPESRFMNVNLGDKFEQLVRKRVETGRYNNASEVIREALRLLEERDELRALRKEELRKKIAEGLDSLRAGKIHDGEEVFDRIEAELDQLERPRRA